MNSAPLHSPGSDFIAGALSSPEGPAGSPPGRKVKFRRAEGHQGRKSKSKSRAQKGVFLKMQKVYLNRLLQRFFGVKWASAGSHA